MSTMSGFSPDNFKRAFPLFQQPENRQLVYLDNAATTQKPQVVIDALCDFYLHSNANTHRSSHRLARRATDMLEGVRRDAVQFLGAASAREIIFTRGATEGLNLLAHSLCADLEPGDEILLSTAEHHANLVPWQMVAERRRLVIRYLPEVAGVPQFERLPEALSTRTRIVSITAGSNALGFRTDLAQVRRDLAGRDLSWVVDAAQLAAHESIDVQAIGCDFLVCSAHKFYGPTGIGLLYGRESLLERMPPWQGGGEMIADVDLQSSHYADLPHRFEAGTSSLAEIAGLGAAIHFLRAQNRVAMAAHEQHLLHLAHKEIQPIAQVNLLTSAENNLGILTLASEHFAPVDLMQWLDGRDIAVRVGHHCAQPLARAAGHNATLRASLAAYNTEQDVERFVDAVREFVQQLDGAPKITTPQAGGHSGDVNREVEWPEDDLAALDIEQLRQQKNWQDRYRTLMGWSKVIGPKPQIRREENLVSGCESSAWLVHREAGGRHYFAIDSDSRIVKGLAALLLCQLDGKPGAEIDEGAIRAVFVELGLDQQLSTSRSNGFSALLARALEFVES